jgi:hypothetical protein
MGGGARDYLDHVDGLDDAGGEHPGGAAVDEGLDGLPDAGRGRRRLRLLLRIRHLSSYFRIRAGRAVMSLLGSGSGGGEANEARKDSGRPRSRGCRCALRAVGTTKTLARTISKFRF